MSADTERPPNLPPPRRVGKVAQRRTFVPNLEAGDLLEAFLISGVSAILLLRLYLYLTGFPQVGGGNLHIAHMLYGGLLMAVSIVLVLNFLDRRAHYFSAVIGGIGFGVFIDELGKFITRDINYFYRPAVSIIYMIFVLFYVFILWLTRHRTVSEHAYIVNVLRAAKEATLRDEPSHQLTVARRYLSRAPSHDALRTALDNVLDELEGLEREKISRLTVLERRHRAITRLIVSKKHFQTVVLAVFIVHALASVAQAVAVTAGETRTYDPITFGEHMLSTPFAKYGDVVFSLLSDCFAVLGIMLFARDRLRAFQFFKVAILISIFLTDFFVFYAIQFKALVGFSLDLLILITLNYLLRQERFRQVVHQARSAARVSYEGPSRLQVTAGTVPTSIGDEHGGETVQEQGPTGGR